jgi:hypothetical protein
MGIKVGEEKVKFVLSGKLGALMILDITFRHESLKCKGAYDHPT